jgi:hypothetical protein
VSSLHVLAASWPRPVPTRSKCIFRPSVVHLIYVTCSRPRQWQTRCEAGTQSHGPLLRRGGRAAERRIEGMSSAHQSIPIGILAFKNDRERLIRTKPIHELYGHLDRRQSAYVEARNP